MQKCKTQSTIIILIILIANLTRKLDIFIKCLMCDLNKVKDKIHFVFYCCFYREPQVKLFQKMVHGNFECGLLYLLYVICILYIY